MIIIIIIDPAMEPARQTDSDGERSQRVRSARELIEVTATGSFEIQIWGVLLCSYNEVT